MINDKITSKKNKYVDKLNMILIVIYEASPDLLQKVDP